MIGSGSLEKMITHLAACSPSFANRLTVSPPSSVGGTIHMDEMRVLPGEGNGGPRDITRESQNWRAAVFSRLGTTMDTATRIDQHTREQMAHMKKEIKILRREVRQLTYWRKVPSATTKLTRGDVETVEGAPAPRQPATLCPRPKSLRSCGQSGLTESMEGFQHASSHHSRVATKG